MKKNAGIEKALRVAIGEIASALDDAREKMRAEVRAEVEAEVLARLGKPVAAKPARRKAPAQLCPAPGCKNRAAPVFGMVCVNHKKSSKATVAMWRRARQVVKAANAEVARKAKKK